MSGIELLGASLFSGLAMFCFVLMIYALNSAVPPENRDYMDPLPILLRLVWPLVRVIAYYACTNLSSDYLDKIEKRLQHTGVAYMVTAEQFVALRFLATMVGLMFAGYVVLFLEGVPALPMLLLGAVIGYFYPELWISDTKRRRDAGVNRDMPVYLDFITMAVEAGLNLSGALSQAREKGPVGALRNEFGIVLRDIRSGLPRAEALKRMAARLDITEVTSFVSTVVQAEKMGSSMATVLRVQSEQRRTERFQRAEKLAMEAPVKLVGPLVMFIFPVTFIVIGFPIVMKFLGEGIL